MTEIMQSITSWLLLYWPWLVLGAVSLIAITFLWGLWGGGAELRRHRDLETRVGEIEAEPSEGVYGALTPALAAQIPESQRESAEFGQLLRRAGLYSPSAQASVYATRFLLLFVPLVLTGVFAILLTTDYTLRVLIIGGLAAAALSIIPRLYVFSRQRRRVRQISHGLSDMMDMLSMCISGGLPIITSLDHVSQNLSNYPALSEELRILRRQAEVGSLQHALVDFGARIDLPEVRQLSNMLTRGDQLGTQLSSSLHEQADHFRATRKQLATMQANKAPVKLTFPLLLCFAPAALILLMAPALLEVRDFLNDEQGPLGNRPLVETIQQIDQATTPDIVVQP